MNILHVTPYYAPAWAYGGVVQAVTGLAEAQAANGHQVTVLTTDTLDRHHRLPVREELSRGVRVVREKNLFPGLRSLWNLSTPLHFGSALNRLLTESAVDVIHCHELRTAENVAAASRARQSGIAIVVSPHGTLPYETGRGFAKRAWDRALGGRWLRSFDLVHALTADEADQAKALWSRFGLTLSAERLRVIPNGVTSAAPIAPERRTRFRQRWGLGSGSVVLFLGRLARRKRLPLLVSAFAALIAEFPDIRLLLVGPDDGARGEVVHQVERLNLTDRVTLTGLLAGDEKLDALAAGDVFVLPSAGEGMPMAALEAMASGLPVVAGEAAGLGEAAAAGAVVVAGADEAALVLRLRTLLLDGDRRSSMGSAGRELVSLRYTWPLIAERMDEAYDAALRTGRLEDASPIGAATPPAPRSDEP